MDRLLVPEELLLSYGSFHKRIVNSATFQYENLATWSCKTTIQTISNAVYTQVHSLDKITQSKYLHS